MYYVRGKEVFLRELKISLIQNFKHKGLLVGTLGEL